MMGVTSVLTIEVSTGSGSDRVELLSNLDAYFSYDPVATAPGTDSITIEISDIAKRRLAI